MSQDRLIWAEQCEERREKKSLRHKLSTATAPPVKPHLRPSSTLRSPTVIPNNKDHPPVIIVVVIITEVESYLKQLLPVAVEPQGRVEIPFSLFLVKFTEFCLERFFLGCSSCLFLGIIFLGSPFPAAGGSLISDYSSNLCKLKPCQMELKGLSVCHI